MTILFSLNLEAFAEAAILALSEAGVDDVSHETMELMATMADPSRLRPLADTALDRAVRHRWARGRFSENRRYYVVVPWLKYDARAIPSLVLDAQTYVVAGGKAISVHV